MQSAGHDRTTTTGWSAAKYLSYAFWRAWFLVMYSGPIWLPLISSQAGSLAPGTQMYYVSTVMFIVALMAISLAHAKAVRLLALRRVMLICGVTASAGVVMEFASLLAGFGTGSALFLVGAALTGVCTAPIAIRSGQVYAATRVPVAVTSTLLSDVAAGLVFFFCLGTWPAVGLFVAVVLPLLSAVMIVLTPPSTDAAIEDVETVGAVSAPRGSFARFLLVAFFIGAVAFLQNGLGNSWFEQGRVDAGLTMGVSLLIMVSFSLAVLFYLMKSLQFETMYRPIVFCLIAFVVVAYLFDFGNPIAIGGTFMVYCLFSSFMWMFMAYLGHSRYFSPVQVFGYGRSAYSAGSLAGCLVGAYVLPSVDVERTLPVLVVAMVAVLLICAVAVRRQDVSSILMIDAQVAGAGLHGAAAMPCVRHAQGTCPAACGGEAIGEGADSCSVPSAAVTGDALPEEPEDDEPAASDLSGLLGEVHLSPRESEVFELMKAGRDSEYIANSLCISRNTAKTHIRNIYAKFGVHRRQDFIDVIQDL